VTFRKADESLLCSEKRNRFFKPALIRSKQIQPLSILSINKCIVFLLFLNEVSVVIHLFTYFHQQYLLLLLFPFIRVLIFSLFGINFASLILIIA
jgi:hypothetical protein